MGADASALIEPSFASRTTTAPAFGEYVANRLRIDEIRWPEMICIMFWSDSSATRWMSRSSVVRTVSPGIDGISLSTRTKRPSASTSSRRCPGTPRSALSNTDSAPILPMSSIGP